MTGKTEKAESSYRGRIAPTPTGFLHLGHAATFGTAHRRARSAGGEILLRIEDLDPRRCKPEFAAAAEADLRWLGLDWDGEPIHQSSRHSAYLEAWKRLCSLDVIYPCERSRKDIALAGLAPHAEDEESLFPLEWRKPAGAAAGFTEPGGMNWRFRVPDGRPISFDDGRLGRVTRIAGVDFGDFLVWNREDVTAYELAVVVDDIEHSISEVVRGEDLLTSTCRQLLIYEALGANPPAFYHCPLLRDRNGRRLAKRSQDLSLASLREKGMSPEEIWKLVQSSLTVNTVADDSFTPAAPEGSVFRSGR